MKIVVGSQMSFFGGMKFCIPLPKSTGSVALATLAAVAGSAATAAAQTAPDPTVLEGIVVSATRTPQELKTTPSSVTVLSLPDMDTAQITDLKTALATAPGVSVTNVGSPGAMSEVRIRGANTHQTLFMVDGIRMNDRTAGYSNFLGGADLAGLDRIEILRGPQSTLYGSAGMGGVIVLETARGGPGPVRGVVSAGGGSFDTFQASAAASGSQGKFSYSASISRFQTQNDLPSNDFDVWAYSTRLEMAVNDRVTVGATFRGQVADYEETGGYLYPSPGENKNYSHLFTAYADVKVTDTFRSHLTLGWHQSENEWTDKSGSPWAADLKTVNTREILDWQNTWQAASWLELVAGINYENMDYRASPLAYDDELVAGYLSATVRPVENVSVTGGLRYDDYDSVGDHTTGRIGVAWYVPQTDTTLRATYGTGFVAPSMADRYGGAWQPANPDIKPEKSKGWDIGFDQALWKNRVALSATYFRNEFRDMFGYDPVTFMTTNTEKAFAQGVEVAVGAKITDIVRARVAWTYLDTEDKATGWQLARRPRHTLDAQITVQPVEAWIVGVGGRFVADRTDAGNARMEDYATMRLFTSYEVRKDLFLKARIENVCDKSYEEAAGYRALPFGAYGSIEWRF
ncbi:TonB-denpendent receptor [Opitutaceae bacterium TAV5]|nr:TonB-denpendent receptor [Opitutaceae bacterium TAV5]